MVSHLDYVGVRHFYEQVRLPWYFAILSVMNHHVARKLKQLYCNLHVKQFQMSDDVILFVWRI